MRWRGEQAYEYVEFPWHKWAALTVVGLALFCEVLVDWVLRMLGG